MTRSWFCKERIERKARETVPECQSVRKTSGHSLLSAARSWKTSAPKGGGPTGSQIIEQFRCVLFCLTHRKPSIGIIGVPDNRANRAVAL